MRDDEFRQEAERALERLYQALVRASEEHDFEVDYGETITVEFPSSSTKFVISPNAAVKQIWVSANARSYKCEWNDEVKAFVFPDTGKRLEQLVAERISEQLKAEIIL